MSNGDHSAHRCCLFPSSLINNVHISFSAMILRLTVHAHYLGDIPCVEEVSQELSTYER